MTKYVYAAVDRTHHEFEGSSLVSVALIDAEDKYGKGGSLFQYVATSEDAAEENPVKDME